jgi:hypothetical protein
MTVYEYDIPEAKAAREGALGEFDRELSELDEAIEKLAQRIGPVTNQYGTIAASAAEPRPEPSSQIRVRVERLRAMRMRLTSLTGDIDL